MPEEDEQASERNEAEAQQNHAAAGRRLEAILAELAEAGAPMRFSRLMERVEGVTQKSLTKVLRQLERDGLVTRQVFAQVPPRVEYAITELALEMLELVHPLWAWAAANVGRFAVAQARYDATLKKSKV